MTYRFLSPAQQDLAEAVHGLLYTVEQDVVIISAVMDLRRNPESWQKRL